MLELARTFRCPPRRRTLASCAGRLSAGAEAGTAACRFAFAILLQAKAILKDLPTILEVPVPTGTHFTVCGDVHGQARSMAMRIR